MKSHLVLMYLGLLFLAGIWSCNESNNAGIDKASQVADQVQFEGRDLLGTWILADLEINAEEILAKINSSDFSEEEKRSAPAELANILEPMKEATVGLKMTFFEDGVLKSEMKGAESFGTYRFDSNERKLTMQSGPEEEVADVIFTKLTSDQMEWYKSGPIPLEDGSGGYIMGKITFKLLKVK